MLKLGFLIVLFVGSCLADVAGWNDVQADFKHGDKYGSHYTQHEASVNAARKGAAERLARISSDSVAGNPCGSTICYSNSGFSDNSDAETVGQGIVGFTGGSSSASSSKYQASSHREAVKSAVPVYPAVEGSKSSYVSASQRHSASSVSSGQPLNYIVGSDGVKTRSNFAASSGSTVVQPIIASAYPIGQETSQSSFSAANRDSTSGVYAVPVDTSNAYRTRSSYTAASERESSSVAQPVLPVYASGDHASKYVTSGRQENRHRYSPSSTYVVYGNPIPVRVYTPVNSNFESSSRLGNSESSVVTPVKVYPVRTADQYSSAEDLQSVQSANIQPIPVYASSSDHSSQAASNYRSSSSYRPVYQPVYNNRVSASDRTEESHSETSDSAVPVVAAVPVVSSASERQEERYGDYTRKGSTHYVPVAVGSGLTSSQLSAHDHRRTQTGSSYVPIVPTGGSTSSSSSQYSAQERREQKGHSYVPIVPIGSTSSSSSKYSAQDEHHQRAAGYPYVPVSGTSSSLSSQYSAQDRRQQQTAGGSYYPIGAVNQGSRYSASESANSYNQQRLQGGSFVPYPITNDDLGQRFGAGGLSFGTNNDLGELMTESERLAKLQAKNAYQGAVAGSSAIDTENRFGDDSISGSDSGLGGFKRTKSWSSSSKWASGQKYDDAGKVKSYSSLSTAESEQHNIDGKKTGYKAATTTLEDDGKVSTYSLHTP
ncbi:mucin-21 isoform X2 [Malaya genurostris]|uniref:mucin-21 isoform X2 n=1 Tax=Malaya genurostris TaxID=325434 RepID=UPI0026F3BFC9|nr:mucin-21 isoform X2 [Malaya genurostris]